MAKTLKADDINYLLSIRKENFTADIFKDLFTISDFSSVPRFNFNDKFTLSKGTLFNDQDIITTVGRYIVNLLVFPKRFLHFEGYINETLNKKNFESLESKLGEYVLDDLVTTKEYAEYIDNATWLFLGQSYLVCPSIGLDIVKPIPEVIKERDELFDTYSEDLKNGKSSAISYVEDTLKKKAKKILAEKDIKAMDYYDAGVLNFDNEYKKASIMIGAIKNPAIGKTEMIKSNFADGVKKDEYGVASNLSVVGGYARYNGTRASGYSTKKMLNVTSGEKLGEAGSDCGTPYGMDILLDNDNYKALIDRYIIENGKLVLLDRKTIKKYIGKRVIMRSPMYCHAPSICSKCAGEQYYRLGITNLGVHTNAAGGSLLNLGMKAFHDATIKYYSLDLEKFIE